MGIKRPGIESSPTIPTSFTQQSTGSRRHQQSQPHQKLQERKASMGGGENGVPPEPLAPLLPRSGLPFLRALLCPSAEEGPLVPAELLALLDEGLRWVWYRGWAPAPLIRLASSSSCFTDLTWDSDGHGVWDSNSHSVWDSNSQNVWYSHCHAIKVFGTATVRVSWIATVRVSWRAKVRVSWTATVRVS